MILRKASYQEGACRQQLESGQEMYPVICIVIDWTRISTRIPLSLHELLKQNGTAQDSLQLTDDMKLEIYHMKNLPKDVRLKFSSDIGFVADFLNEGGFESRRKQKIVHVEVLCKMMEVLTGDDRFTNKINSLLKIQEGGREEEVKLALQDKEARK